MLEFKDEVERETGGEIMIRIFPSAMLYKDREVPQAVSSGAVEVGVASLTVLADEIPAVDIFYVPFMFPSRQHVRRATGPNSPIRREIDAAVLQTGARVLWWQAFGSTVTLSRGEAFRRPDDMVGKKVRVFGKTLGVSVKAVGGEPVLISGSDQFDAYRKGDVDAGVTGLSTIPSRRLYEVMDFVSLTSFADIEFVVLINEGVWQGLSDHHRAVMTSAASRVENELRDEIDRLESEALDFIRGKMKVVEISDEDLAAWRKATSSVIDIYLENAGAMGARLVSEAGKIDHDLLQK
jgi:C4-dicarboxylate-binding protein DctP